MPQFTVTGNDKNDLWHVDGSPDFAILPAQIIRTIGITAPIWLKVGTDAGYGAQHIQAKHYHWVSRQNKTVPELVYFKLGQAGSIYCTEKHSKLKLSLSINPQAVLVLDLYDRCESPHFSVTTLYGLNHRLDGDIIGRYPGREKAIQILSAPQKIVGGRSNKKMAKALF